MTLKRFFVIVVLILLAATFYSFISHEKYLVAGGYILALLMLFGFHAVKVNKIITEYEEKDEDPVERLVHMIIGDAIIKKALRIKINIKPKSFTVSYLLFNEEKYPDATALEVIENEDHYYDWFEVMKPPMKLADRMFLYIKKLFQYTIDDGQTTRKTHQPVIQVSHMLKIDDTLTQVSSGSTYLEIQEDGLNAILEQIEKGVTLDEEFCIAIT